MCNGFAYLSTTLRGMRWWLSLVAVVATASLTEAVLKRIDKNDGSVQTTLLSDSTNDGYIASVSVKGSGTRIYAIDLIDSGLSTPPIEPRVRSVVGQRVVSKEILVGPRGCDNPNDPLSAIEHSNCATTTVERRVSRENLHRLWYLPSKGRNVDECFSRGGDEFSCVGPPIVLNDHVDAFAPRTVTEKDLLVARGVVVEAASGWLGAIPSVVRVDMILPHLYVSTDATYLGDSFTAQYRTFHYDAYSKLITDVWMAFERADGYLQSHRVLLRRLDPNAATRSFRIQIALAQGTGQDENFFIVALESVDIFTPSNNLERWADLVPFATPIVFRDVSNNGTHNVTFTIVSAPNPPELRDPEVVSDRTFMKGKIFHPEMYETCSCNYAVGEYDTNGELKFAYTPEGALRGGYARYVTPNFPHLPIYVPPDVRYQAYQDDCDKAYPRAASFLGFEGTATYQRMVASEHRCFAPMLINQKITDAIVVEERELQCTKRGMSCATRTCDVCARRITDAPCKADYLPFDQRCWYKPDPTKDLDKRVVIGESNAACAAIDPELGGLLTATVAPDVYLKAWLQSDFVHWKKRGTGFPFRLPTTASRETAGASLVLPPTPPSCRLPRSTTFSSTFPARAKPRASWTAPSCSKSTTLPLRRPLCCRRVEASSWESASPTPLPISRAASVRGGETPTQTRSR